MPDTNLFENYQHGLVTVKAAQWEGSVEQATQIIEFILSNGGLASYQTNDDSSSNIRVVTIDGPILANFDNWIIFNELNEFEVVDTETFDNEYKIPEEEEEEPGNA